MARVGDGFSEGRWNSKAIQIMNELVQMAPVPIQIYGLSVHQHSFRKAAQQTRSNK